ncbi:MAG TPA: glycosyltransferase family 9 protein [Candidatus Acidoferrales bacterium]|nr:glycosyltransferase family 9 protein [Candidatus Acidoferrales bacterium]
MAEERFLILRMGALGDIVHTLPPVAALRESFPRAEIDWLVDRKWAPILDGNPDVSRVIAIDRTSSRNVIATVRRLRAAHYTTALDFQSLYRSAILGRLSGAPRRVGFDSNYAREGGAALFYTEKVTPRRTHKVGHNLELAESIGAQTREIRFPLHISADTVEYVNRVLAARGVNDFFVLSPGGGWGSKCWPAERYGVLHEALVREYGWRGVISFGPGERDLAEIVRREAGPPGPGGSPEPLVESFNLPQLIALLRRAKFIVAADTGPLHLASALGTPVIGLYGPTDPARNGPFSKRDVIVRNASPEETTYRRDRSPAPSMLSITVEQVLDAVARRLRTA